MKRPLTLSMAFFMLIVLSSLPRIVVADPQPQKLVPRSATVEILLLKAPGINATGSKWEIAYDFRIANQATEWKAWKEGKLKGGSEQRVGELIKEGAVEKPLHSPESRRVVFQIPFNSEIQVRLKEQPRDLDKVTPDKVTPEDIKLLKDQEMKIQVFFFHCTINIYDATLKKTFIIPASRVWPFSSYPQARFEIKVEIHDDGSYSVKSSLPAKESSD
jgi:hypothetical protein